MEGTGLEGRKDRGYLLGICSLSCSRLGMGSPLTSKDFRVKLGNIYRDITHS